MDNRNLRVGQSPRFDPLRIASAWSAVFIDSAALGPMRESPRCAGRAGHGESLPARPDARPIPFKETPKENAMDLASAIECGVTGLLATLLAGAIACHGLTYLLP